MITILLAEDNSGDVLLVRKALSEHHIQHQLFVVNDGAEAIEYLSKMGNPGNPPCPDLMLLDLNLPKVDGPDVLREFREHSACKLTPVIIVSSSDAQKDRAAMVALGVAYYFRKPSDLDGFMKLGGIVRQVMDEPNSSNPEVAALA